MEQKTIGKFLSTLRKANGYTQQQVADFLCVSNKTVSKWERDEGYSEITMLPAIAELYGVTVDEILKGERIENPLAENIVSKIEEHRKLLMEKSALKFKNLCIVSVALGASASVLSFFLVSSLGYPYCDFASALVFLIVVAAIVVLAIAYNSYMSALKSEDIEPKMIHEAKLKGYRMIPLEVIFTTTTIAGILSFYDTDYISIMAIITVIALIAARIILNKKLKNN